MAIKFTDDTGSDPAAKRPSKAPAAAPPIEPAAETQDRLPFAKPVKPEKKRKGR